MMSLDNWPLPTKFQLLLAVKVIAISVGLLFSKFSSIASVVYLLLQFDKGPGPQSRIIMDIHVVQGIVKPMI